MKLDQFFGDGKAQPRPLLFPLSGRGLLERKEQPRQFIRPDANSGILNAELDRVLDAQHIDRDGVLGMAELDRVGHEIEDDLFETDIVRNNIVELVCNMNFERQFLFFHLRLKRLCQCFDELVDRNALVMEFQFSRFKLREVQNIVDELEKMFSALIDRRNV